jgi:sigma-B regulation protein RsbU (phosphoserine phosphatase)
MFFSRKKAADQAPGPGVGAQPGHGSERPGAPSAAGSAESDREPVSPVSFLSGDQRADARKVDVLLRAIRRVSEVQQQGDTLEGLLGDIVEGSIEVTGAERGLLVMEGDGGLLEVRVSRTRGGSGFVDERFSTTIARRVLDGSEPIKATVQSDSEALELGRSAHDLKLRAVMCVPLEAFDGRDRAEASGRPQGVLYVDSRVAKGQFRQSDLALFSALAQHISVALRNAQLSLERLENERMRRQLEESEAIQKHLMPRLPDDQRGFDLHGWYRPAEHAAGDFFDFVDAAGGGLAVVVGDVSGHGIGPALITASAQGHLSAYLSMMEDLPTVVTKLNADLSRRIETGRFMTLLIARLEADGRVVTINAGHQPALVWRAATGTVEELPGGDLAVGILADHDYAAATCSSFEPGDALLAYTDGVVEARSPGSESGFLGREGLAQLFGDCMREGLSARSAAMRLADAALSEGGGRVDDDVTLVVARRL